MSFLSKVTSKYAAEAASWEDHSDYLDIWLFDGDSEYDELKMIAKRFGMKYKLKFKQGYYLFISKEKHALIIAKTEKIHNLEDIVGTLWILNQGSDAPVIGHVVVSKVERGKGIGLQLHISAAKYLTNGSLNSGEPFNVSPLERKVFKRLQKYSNCQVTKEGDGSFTLHTTTKTKGPLE